MVNLFWRTIGLATLVIFSTTVVETKEKPPVGILAASAGEEVILVDPTTGDSMPVSAGPVAWLFPAPGGVLFAPDLVNGKTTVIDLRTLSLQDPIPGVTMPHFGTLTDRYLVLSNQLLVMSYPNRALMNRFEISFESPWQVEILAGNTVLFVLERTPVGGGEAMLTAVNLGEGRLVYRRPLGGDVRFFAVSPVLGVMALAVAEANQALIVEPATLNPAAAFPTTGRPVDLVFADDGTTLVVTAELAEGKGELLIWKIKHDKKEGLQRKKEWTVPLDGTPVRLVVSPDGRHVAVAFSSGELQIVELETQTVVATGNIGGAPRDVVWCDPSIEGPMLPDWSDDDEPTLDLGGR